MGFWNQDHPLSKEFSRLWDKYVPMSGTTDYAETELLRAANSIIYDWYNNGWGVNNKTPELEYLQNKGLFEEITPEDLAEQNGDKFEQYMDDELAAIIELVLEAEESDSLTPLDIDFLSELGLSRREWDKLTYQEDEEDDYWEDDEDEEEFDESYSRLKESYDHIDSVWQALKYKRIDEEDAIYQLMNPPKGFGEPFTEEEAEEQVAEWMRKL